MSIWDDEFEDKLFKSWFSPSPKRKKNKRSTNPFVVGDSIRLLTGSSPITVTAVQGDIVYGKYRNSNYTVERNYKHFSKYEEIMQKYKVAGSGEIGTLQERLGTDRMILAMPTGRSEVHNVRNLTPVQEAYTFEVKFPNSATRYAYIGDRDSVEVGDILILDGSNSFATVVATNTLSDRATKRFIGRKVQTTKL